MGQMMGLYLQEIPGLVQAMKHAIATQDWIALKRATHSLIPTFATMGMDPTLEELTKTIQSQAVTLIAVGDGASAATLATLAAMFARVEAACGQAAEELTARLRTM